MYSGSSDHLLHSQVLKRQKEILKRDHRPNICSYWKSILTLFMFGSVLIVIVTLSVYFTHGRNRTEELSSADPLTEQR